MTAREQHNACIGSTANEATPLLQAACCIEDASAEPLAESNKPASFPKHQVLLLCYARLMESITFFLVFPYIAQMIQQNARLPQHKVGFYSGLIESAASVAEVATLAIWCRLSDNIGRKPALVLSMLGLAVGPALFGLSGSIAEMMLFRLLTGAFAGAGLAIRTMLGDLTTCQTQAVAYSWFSMADFAGSFVGPLLGGTLADAAKQLPRIFGGFAFLHRHPYALPGFVVAVLNMSAAAALTLFLQETLVRKPAPSRGKDRAAPPEQGRYKMLLTKVGLFPALAIYGQVMLVASFYIAILPVALYTPISLGGLECSPPQIAAYMGVQALGQTIWVLYAFPRMHRRLGTNAMVKMCAYVFPLLFLCFVAMNALLRRGGDASLTWFWIVCFLSTLLGPVVFVSIVVAQLAVNEVSSDPRLLGSLNTLLLMVCNLVRIGAPGLATALYAIGVENQVLGGYLGWILSVPLSASFYITAHWLPGGK
jgi:MFS family permease